MYGISAVPKRSCGIPKRCWISILLVSSPLSSWWFGGRRDARREVTFCGYITDLGNCSLPARTGDNDNDTLREVPHPSNEGLALQARVSAPLSHKKESVLLVELARWQGAQVQTVGRQIVMQRYLK